MKNTGRFLRRAPELGLALLLAGSCNCSSSRPTAESAATSGAVRGPSGSSGNEAVVTGRRSGPPRDVLIGGPWNQRSPLGTNLSGFVDWGTELPYVDLFKSSRSWISGTEEEWENDTPIDVDENGWVRSLRPGQVVRTLLLWETTRYPAGRYVVRYEGEGEIEYHRDSAARVVESSPGRDVLDIDPSRSSNGILFHLRQVNPDNYIRNVRVYLPGGSCERAPLVHCDSEHPCAEGECIPFEEAEGITFNPAFVDLTKRYSVIRYLDWVMTNDSRVRTWSDRTTLSDARWTETGAPPEAMVALSNQLNAEPWFTVPHLADDDYNRRFATLVKETLDPSLRVWVEYSNEVWNAMFSQSQHAEQEGRAAGLSEDAFEALLRWYAKRSVEVLRIWNDVLGEDRVVAVVATQAANVWTGQTVLEFEDTAEVADVIAIAPYFGLNADHENEQRIQGMTVDQLAAKTRGEIMPEVFGWMDEYAALAREKNLQLVAYEGGQHFVGGMGAENNDRINRLFDAINRDERMGGFYAEYLRQWRRRGGTLFCNFTNVDGWSKWGRWGALEHLDQPPDDSPRFRALMNFIDQNPRWW